ncbi:MAG TPA: aspartate aminotransferase family protein [Treponemataceae bacterium]|nr:aspartate aminotransferase family protein [Treponemataceae bacterium]
MSKIANNYGSFPVVFTKGEGAVLTDTAGKTYIDFVSGIGVNCLGHNHPALVKALSEQAAKQIHISNYYLSDIGLSYAEELLRETGMERAFFGNSGAEANECAIKLARKYGLMTGNPDKKIIVTLEKSFHGRTIATLRATGQDKFHNQSFAPYPEGFMHIKAQDYEALNALPQTVCAVFIEAVQGEGGVNLIDAEWAQALEKKACELNALFMVDEVQTGMSRTGSLLASTRLGLTPDVITLAKGIAGGVPMGACIFKGKAKDVFIAGDHQSTFGGNPLACAAASAVLKELTKKDFLDHVNAMGDFLRKTVSGWKLDCVKEVRGRGLMIGIDITQSAGDIQKKCLEMGLCVSTAGPNTIRFLPPLIISQKEIEAGLDLFKKALSE